MTVIRAYFNERADIWDETVAEKDTAKLERMATRLNLKPGFKILDVGTGTGVFLPFIFGKIGQDGQVIAIDIADEMLLKAKVKGLPGNIDYLCADVMEIPVVGEVFDAVVCYSSFPHFQDKPKAFAEMLRVIKPGGSLMICHTSSRAHINEIHSQIPDVRHDILPAGDDMQLLLSAAGFSDIAIEDDSDSYLARASKPQMV
ncbi:MAG: methyltransferase domain-containing protein [Dehalococcoidales bacterium]|nr:MAG: methyltransferase domain-containing protein [Dehalococcoidales bacterium]